MAKKGNQYESAGVDRKLADRFVDRIGKLALSTTNEKVRGGIGGYASLYHQDGDRYLASSTDGVGTKLKLAFESGIHHTIGIDLVAMSVNDLLCVGAKPSFFLDYFATGKLSPKTGMQVLQGIVEGCKEARIPLVGGETAEMPGLYGVGEYDLAGFAVGEVRESGILPKKEIGAGCALLGLTSSGFHSNGFSLLRKNLPKSGSTRKKLVKKLLSPTRIYVKSLMELLDDPGLLGLSHITGSGFLNVPRISEGVSYEIRLPEVSALPLPMGEMIARMKLSLREEVTTFNAGVGMVLVVEEKSKDRILRRLKVAGETPLHLGRTIPLRAGKKCELLISRRGSKEPKEEEIWIQY